MKLQILNCGLDGEITALCQGLKIGLFWLLERLFGKVHGCRSVRLHDQSGGSALDGKKQGRGPPAGSQATAQEFFTAGESQVF